MRDTASRSRSIGFLMWIAFTVGAAPLVHGAPGILASPPDSAPVRAELVNGNLTSGFPSSGALLVGNDPRTADSWCSGVLVGCRTFLTAAHCVCQGDGADCQGTRAPSPHSRLVYLQHAGFFEASSISVHPDYHFPVADLAVVRLSRPVTAIPPARITDVAPGTAVPGIVVGFGRSSGRATDYGLKRSGAVLTAPCGSGLPEGTTICWSFDGTGASTCEGDSGGPLFVDLGSGPALAGVTSAGTSETCSPGDLDYDTNLSRYRTWILAQAGTDLDRMRCGGIPQVGEPGTATVSANGALAEANPAAAHSIEVPAGTNELRFALNGTDDGLADFDLYVKAGSPPTTDDFDCRANGKGQYGYCEFLFPASGTWHALVRRTSGAGTYQLTATALGGAPPVCGNDLLESGEQCDGADDDGCPGACDATCQCPPSCREGAFADVRARIGREFTVRAVLMNGEGTYDELDPRASDLALSLSHRGVPVNVAIRAGDPGWTTSARNDRLYRWKGLQGRHRLRLTCRKLRNGNWQIIIRGREALVIDGAKPAA